MAVISPVSERATVVALLMLTFATGLVDAISVLVLGHVFVANMTGKWCFSFWLARRPPSTWPACWFRSPVSSWGGDRWTVCSPSRGEGADLARHRTRDGSRVADDDGRSGRYRVIDYHTHQKVILIACLALTFGAQECGGPAVRRAGAEYHGAHVDDRRHRGSTVASPVVPVNVRSCESRSC